MAQPHQSSTIPHGFRFHYDEQPKTPEREMPPPSEVVVEKPRGFFVRRRRAGRPRVDSNISARISEMLNGLQETTLPSIEVTEQEAAAEPEPQSAMLERFLTPQPIDNAFLHTPAGRERAVTPIGREAVKEAFNRTSSPFSGMSDSDDEDDASIGSEDGTSHGGSVTSPENDDSEPFQVKDPSSPSPQFRTPKRCWTKAMDDHLWAVYTRYLNNPTITPFKTLPGCPPPVGVVHRIASEARKTWKGPRPGSGHLTYHVGPDTIPGQAGNLSEHFVPWPGAGSATRRRFRKLCKRKATISPHYQRMMRTPSPQPGDVGAGRSRARTPVRRSRGTTRTGSPIQRTPVRNPFATRDWALSLTTSFSTTMQPGGVLSQMAHSVTHHTWTNGQSQSSAMDSDTVASNVQNQETVGASINRLGSPFSGSSTWGPSNLQSQERSTATNLVPPGSISYPGTVVAPRLGSPVHFGPLRDEQPVPSRMPKRPATSALGDDEPGSGNAAARRTRHEDVSGSSFLDASRRLRLRGMSLGARFAGRDPFVSEPSTVAGGVTNEASLPFASLPPGLVRSVPLEDPFSDAPQRQPAPRLRSPFPGINSRPNRSRHAASLSLPSVGAPDLDSIDQRMSSDVAE